MDTERPASTARALLRRHGLDALAAVAVGGALAFNAADRSNSPVPNWIATVALLLGLVHLAPRLRPLAARLPHDRLAALAPYLAVTITATWALWPLPLGVLPISQDHAQHYLAHRVLIDDLIGDAGLLFGWTHRVSTGLPFGDVYPTGAYLITAAPHLLTFGLIPVDASYAIGVFAGWLTAALAVVAWTRRLAGGWIGPTFAGLALLLDVGGSRQGGWYYSFFLGVWPQFVATGIWLLSLLAMVRLAERQTVGRLAAAVLITGYAFWAHAFNAFNLLAGAIVLVPLYLLLRPADPTRDDPRLGAVWMIAAFGLAALIGLGWISLFANLDDELRVAIPADWGTLEDRVLALLEGRPFDFQAAVVGAAALIGAGLAILRRRPLDIATVTLVALLLVLVGQDAVAFTELGLHEDHPIVMHRRFSMTLKPLWYSLAGLGLAGAIAGARALAAQHAPTPLAPTPRPLNVLFLVALAPLAWSAWAARGGVIDGPVADVLTAEKAMVTEELTRLGELLRAEAARLGPGAPHRVVSDHRANEHGHYELFPIADAGFGYLPTLRPPCQTYKHINARRSAAGWRWLGATLVIAPAPRRHPGAALVEKVGRYHVYRLQDEARWPARVLSGPGAVEVLEWAPHHIRLRLSDTAPGTRVQLGLPPYPKWQATLGQRAIELTPSHGPGGYLGLAFEAPADGEAILTYQQPPAQAGALKRAYALIALALLGLLAWRVRLPAWPAPRHRPKLVVAAFGGAALAAIAITWSLTGDHDEATAARWLDDRGGEVLERLHRRRPDHVAREPASACVRPFTRDPRPECNERLLEPTLHVGRREGTQRPTCLRFGIPDGGATHLLWRLPQGTTTVAGRLHTLKKKQPATGTLTAGLDTAGPATVTARSDGARFELPIPAGERVIRFTAEGTGKTTLTCLELTALRRP